VSLGRGLASDRRELFEGFVAITVIQLGVREVIPAYKWEWFSRWFAGQAAKRLRRQFGALNIRGLEHLKAAAQTGPVVVASNHTAWWDGLVALYLIERVAKLDGYALMDETNLRRFAFFARAGGVGVDPHSAQDGARVIRYAQQLLANSRRVLWVFPQGTERPIDTRPLDFLPGARDIARRAKAQLLPVALRYEFSKESKPELWISIGSGLAPEANNCEAAVVTELDRIATHLASQGAMRPSRALEAATASTAFTDLWRSHKSGQPDLASVVLTWLLKRGLPRSFRKRHACKAQSPVSKS